MILGRLKTYAIIAGGALLSALLIAVKILSSKNSKLRVKVETTEARIKHAKKVMEADAETDEQKDKRLSDLAKEIEDNKPPTELTDPDW